MAYNGGEYGGGGYGQQQQQPGGGGQQQYYDQSQYQQQPQQQYYAGGAQQQQQQQYYAPQQDYQQQQQQYHQQPQYLPPQQQQQQQYYGQQYTPQQYAPQQQPQQDRIAPPTFALPPERLTVIPPGWSNPYLPPELVEKAARELNENDRSRAEALAAIRDLMAKEKKIRFHRTDDMYLLSFLRCRKFNVAKAYKNMKAYGEFYEENKHLIASVDMSRLKKMYETGFSMAVPGTDKHGRRLSIIIARKMSMSEELSATDVGEDMIRFNLLLMDYLLQDVYVQVNGLVVVETFEGFTFAQAMRLRKQQDPKMMKKSMALMQGIMPIRLQGIYLLSVPTYVSILMKLAKLFMGAKMRSRIHVWGNDFGPLHEQVDPRELPPELGGTYTEDPMHFWSIYSSGQPATAFYRQGIIDYSAPAPAKSHKDIMNNKMTAEEKQLAQQMGVDLTQPQEDASVPEWTAIED